MYKIGEFSSLSKTTIKALRYYEKEKLLLPAYVDQNTGYRFYQSNQLLELSKIISLRQVGLSIKDIKKIKNGNNIKQLLIKRKDEILKTLETCNNELSRINYLLEENNMNNEIIIKELPSFTIYYKEGIIKNFSEITSFIMSSAEECLKLNPNIKCITPDYCYVNYLDGEYRESDIKIRYAQAVEKKGIENENIKFEVLKPVKAVCIYHKGPYDNMRSSYSKILNYIEENKLEMLEFPREHYIDGMWNKENQEEWLTEIQIPIKNM